MSYEDDNDPALMAIKERDDELRQIVAQAEELGKFKDAFHGISARVGLAESRAKLTGLLRSIKNDVRPDPNVEILFYETEPEDPKVREEREKSTTQELNRLRKSSS